jgi:hypothetical protein
VSPPPPQCISWASDFWIVISTVSLPGNIPFFPMCMTDSHKRLTLLQSKNKDEIFSVPSKIVFKKENCKLS